MDCRVSLQFRVGATTHEQVIPEISAPVKREPKHYYKMWVQFTNPYSLDQWIHYFFTSPCSLQLVNSLKIQWNHLKYMDTFCWSNEITWHTWTPFCWSNEITWHTWTPFVIVKALILGIPGSFQHSPPLVKEKFCLVVTCSSR